MSTSRTDRALRAAFLLAAAGCALPAVALEPDQLFSLVSPSIMLVQTYDADGLKLSLGSAVTIAPEKLLTNCHVLKKSRRIEIKQDNVTYAARLEHIDLDRDLCQISARNFKAPPVKIGDSDKLRVGQKAYAIGNPQGLELTLSDGLVSALRKNEDGALKLIQTSAPVTSGSSGGGLFDSEGRLIGIVTLSLGQQANLNFAVPINWLRDLPERSNAALAARENKRKSEEAAEKAAAQGRAPAALPEKLLSREELNEHFSKPIAVKASTSVAADVTFTTSPDGTLEIAYPGRAGARSWGTYSLKSEQNQMCIQIQRGNPFTPNNTFQDLRGCYQLYRITSKEYVLRSVEDKTYIRYSM